MFARLALEEEVDDVLEMAAANVAETRPGDTFDPDVARQNYWRYLDNANPTIYVVEHKRRLIAFLSVFVGQHRHNTGQFAVQEVLYVRPEFRGTRAAVLLMKHLIAEAERQGISEILGGNDNSFNSDRTRRFLEHFGFKTVGYSMRRQTNG